MTWDQIKQWLRDRCPWWLTWLLDPLIAFVDAIVDAWHALEKAISEHFQIRLFWWGVEFNLKLGDFTYHFLLSLSDWKFEFDIHLRDWGWTFRVNLKDWEFLFHVKLGEFDLFFRINLREWEFLFRVKLGDWGFQFYANLRDWDFIFRVWGEDWNTTFHTNLREWEFSYRTWLGDREFEWRAWLEDRHQELIEFLYGEEGVVTGAIEKLKEWVNDRLQGLQSHVTDMLVMWTVNLFPQRPVDRFPDYEYPDLDTLIEQSLYWLEGEGAKQTDGYDQIFEWAVENVLLEEKKI